MKSSPWHYFLYTVPLVLALARWWAAGNDWSHFIVAGTDHCTSSSITKLHGSGYDGQFFYRYALNPFSGENPYHGIRVDNPAYRQQRILYPFLAWLAAVGNPHLIPFTLVLTNAVALMLILFGLLRLFEQWNVPFRAAWVALLIPGLWMAFARDLAEVWEVCLFVLIVLSYEQKRKWLFLLLATAMVFTRETSAMALLALELYLLYGLVVTRNMTEFKTWALLAALPIALLLAHRYYLFSVYQLDFSAGAGDFTLVPFYGFVDGIRIQLQKSARTGLTGGLELAFYVGNLLFILVAWFACFQSARKNWADLGPTQKWLLLLVVMWLALAVFFSHAIWEDDWGFTRILAMSALAALIVRASQGRLNNGFVGASAGLFLLTFARLVLRA